jgi:hypothetical protein
VADDSYDSGADLSPETDADDSDGAATSQASHDELIEIAHARFKLAQESEKEIRDSALEDKKFRAGEQWPELIRQKREQDGRPCLVINKAPQFIQQITNDQRQNRPSIKVNPVDDQADVETAKIYQGLIRHIESNSGADAARDNAFEGAVTGGFGYYRVITQYVDPMSFDQEILVKRIANEFSAILDPFCQEPDGSDAEWGFVFEDLPKDEYKRLYPDSKLSDDAEWDAVGAQKPDWVTSDGCRIADYYYKVYERRSICRLSTGDVVFKEECAKMVEILSAQSDQPVTVTGERVVEVPSVKWCKLNGCEVLDETDWPGIYIPIIPVYGNELNIDGKRILEGVIRHAKDPARMYNYWASAETEAIALAPRTPWIMAEGQDEGHAAEWATANTRNHSVLKYKPISVGGQPVGPPQRNAFEPAVQAITQARMLASDDYKATTGLFDAARGAQSNETSGRAILARANQAQTGNFHFTDNLTRAIRYEGRILLDLIPKVYDAARAVRILGEDGEPEIIRINEVFERKGEKVRYDLGVGKYDVTVSVGPSYASKRQEAASSMLELSKVSPQVMGAAADLVVKNMDWPGAHEIAERLKKTLPPGLADDPKDKKPLPPEVQAQMAQMSQMIQKLQQDSGDLLREREQRLVEIESRERIEMKKLEVELAIETAKIDAKDSLALLSHEIASIGERLSLLNASAPIDSDDQGQEQPMGAPEPAAPAQVPPGPADGAMSADVSGPDAPLTGEESPGLPVDEIQ